MMETNSPDVRLVAPDIERDAPLSVEWLAGDLGRNTLSLMGVNDANNKPSTLEAEQDRVKEFIERKDQLNWMIEFQGKVVGSVWVDLEPTEEVPSPAVHIMIGDPDTRGKGVGATSVGAVLDYLKDDGKFRVHSRHLTKNIRAKNLLDELNFKPNGEPYTDKDGLEWQNVSRDLVMDSVEENLGIKPQDLTVVEAGKMSETFVYEQDGSKKILRVTDEGDSYLRDQFAGELFAGTDIPVPQILDIGTFKNGNHYAVSEFCEGISSDQLSQDEIDHALPEIWKVLAGTLRAPISNTTGYGYMDTATHNGSHSTWRDYFVEYLDEKSAGNLKPKAKQIGINPELIDQFREQLEKNLQFLPEERFLQHGDFAFDNLLMKDGKVTAVIDWAQIGYGDWYYDFATMEFWWPGRYGDPKEFADKYGFNTDNLEQRKAAYWANRFLGTVNFSADKQHKQTAEWLKEHAEQKLVET